MGVEDVLASKRFYAERGLEVAKSFARAYVEFATAPIKLALYKHRALAKDAGVAPEGTGSHRILISGDAGPFTDPDGFEWEAARLPDEREVSPPAAAEASVSTMADAQLHAT